MRFWIFILCGVFFLTVSSAYANMVITEIMYDLDGADTEREWVEIQNMGSQVDLTGWKFFENGTNHGLVLAQGSVSIPQNGFAIIADNSEKFILDWPNFSGTLFDSSFSLSNMGETLILRDSGLADSDTAIYSSELGANGDGNSLAKVNGVWASAVPIPGQGQSVLVPVEAQAENLSNNNELEIISGSIQEPKLSPFKAHAGSDRSVLAGAEVYFEGEVEGISDDLISKARFLWNFGDGTIGEGKNIKHIFQYPGNYIVNLNANLGSYLASDFVKVSVSLAGILVSEIKPGAYVEIKNDSTKIVDVSGFGIQINNSKIFQFPKDTMLSANSFLTLDTLMLRIEIPDIGEVKILYPNGKILFASKYQSGILGQNESINFDGKFWVRGEVTPGAKNILKKSINQINKIYSGEITPSPIPPPLTIRGGGEGGGVTGEASVISSQAGGSLWSEIKWLIFGLTGGAFLGLVYIFVKHRM